MLSEEEIKKQKTKEYKAEYYRKNKEYILNKNAKYKIENKERLIEIDKEWVKDNIERVRETKRRYKKKNPFKNSEHKARRRATKLNATPKWLTEKQMKEIGLIYKDAKIKEQKTKIKHHVDHIVPLLGKNARGLHVPWNLQILTAEENFKKGNRICQN